MDIIKRIRKKKGSEEVSEAAGTPDWSTFPLPESDATGQEAPANEEAVDESLLAAYGLEPQAPQEDAAVDDSLLAAYGLDTEAPPATEVERPPSPPAAPQPAPAAGEKPDLSRYKLTTVRLDEESEDSPPGPDAQVESPGEVAAIAPDPPAATSPTPISQEPGPAVEGTEGGAPAEEDAVLEPPRLSTAAFLRMDEKEGSKEKEDPGRKARASLIDDIGTEDLAEQLRSFKDLLRKD